MLEAMAMADLELAAKVPDHVFRFVERELYDYPVNREMVLDYLRRRSDVLGRGRQAAGGVGRREGGLPSDPTHSATVRLMALEHGAERARFYVDAIDSVLRVLNEEERKLVKRKYFDRDMTNAGLARELNMSERRLYDVRHGVIRRFAMRFGLV